MAGFTERIKIIIDVATGNSPGAIKDLRSELANTEGGLNKLKVTGSAAMDGLKQNIAGFAMAGGAALVSFAAKAVGEFQNLALAAGKFADATGIGTEAASRWIEVAGDVGVEAGAVEGALLKMERAAASTPEAFKAMGVEIARTQSGAVDANETFIRTLERLRAIPDPAARAAAGTKLLGRSWAEMAEIVESNDIRGALEGVSDAKVIDEAEVAKARRFRDAMDELKGQLEDFTLVVGESVVPILSDLAEQLENVTGPLKELGVSSNSLSAGFKLMTGDYMGFAEALLGTDAATTGTVKSLDAMTRGAASLGAGLAAQRTKALGAADGIDELGGSVDTTAVSAKVLTDQLSAMQDEISDETSLINLQSGLDGLQTKFAELAEEVKSGSMTQEEAMREARLAVLKNKDAVIDYAAKVEGIPASKVSEINAAIDRGDIEEAERLLNEVTRPRSVRVTINPVGDIIGPKGPRAMGGPVNGVHPIAERGPEVVTTNSGDSYLVQSGGSVAPVSQVGMSAGRSPGGGIQFINQGIMTNDQARTVVELVADYIRRNGTPAWLP